MTHESNEACRAIVEALEITRTVFLISWTCADFQDDLDSYITYSTILDIHFAHALTFTASEQITFLSKVHSLLNAPENVGSH